MVDQGWEDTLMGMESELERDLLESLDHRQLEKSSFMKNAVALLHSDQVHRTGPKSYTTH